MVKNQYYIREFGTIRIAGDFDREPGSDFNENTVYLPDRKTFESIVNFINDNKDPDSDKTLPFSEFRKNKKNQIRIRNYVGVIETKDGVVIEILPKIHFHGDGDNLSKTRKIFFKMLRNLKNTPFRQLGSAHLFTSKDFPVLEVFIENYIEECRNLMGKGFRSNYIEVEDNITYLRGKLDIKSNIKLNSAHKNRFYCIYDEFSQDIPQNRIIKTTLQKLLNTTKSYSNYSAIGTLLSRLESVGYSENIQRDILVSKIKNKLFADYENLIQWSEIFLLNKSFTNFKGDSLNTAILFPMERIFESYITHLFSKYAVGYELYFQKMTLYLVEKHKDSGRFGLKPDIRLDKDVERVIIDAKWKLIDENLENKTYQISEDDIYQLYAYGKKYFPPGGSMRLAMIYPSHSNFTKKLEPFYYESPALKLDIFPFSFDKVLESPLAEEEQIKNILNTL